MEKSYCIINFPAISFLSVKMMNKIRKGIITGLLIALVTGHSFGQADPGSVFETRDPLHIALSISIKEIRKSKEDSTYIIDKLYYRGASGANDSIKIGLKGRGNFRLHECYFPPLWIKFKKSETKGTLFEGNKKLKLVLPCNTEKGNIN